MKQLLTYGEWVKCRRLWWKVLWWSGLACLLKNSMDTRTYSASVLTITLISLFPSTGAGILVVFPFFLGITLSWSLPKSLTYVLFSMLSSILIPVHMESLFSSVWFTVIIRRSLSVASSLFNRISKYQKQNKTKQNNTPNNMFETTAGSLLTKVNIV